MTRRHHRGISIKGYYTRAKVFVALVFLAVVLYLLYTTFIT